VWAADQRSVLGDDGVEMLVDVGEPMAKLTEDSTGDEHDPDTRSAELGDGLEHGVVRT
jgi:hypothetical protein